MVKYKEKHFTRRKVPEIYAKCNIHGTVSSHLQYFIAKTFRNIQFATFQLLHIPK